VTLLDCGTCQVHLYTNMFANANVRLYGWSRTSPSGLVGVGLNRTSRLGLVLGGVSNRRCWSHNQWCRGSYMSLVRLSGIGTTRTNRQGFVLGGVDGVGMGWCRLGLPSLLGCVVGRIRILTFELIIFPSHSLVYSKPNAFSNAFSISNGNPPGMWIFRVSSASAFDYGFHSMNANAFTLSFAFANDGGVHPWLGGPERRTIVVRRCVTPGGLVATCLSFRWPLLSWDWPSIVFGMFRMPRMAGGTVYPVPLRSCCQRWML
jgi:hypothetical protein